MAKPRSKHQQTYRCQYGSTSYRHKSMADKCLKTNICRTYNAPSSERRNALAMQVGVATVAQFVLALLIKKNAAGSDKARETEKILNTLFPELHKLQCNIRFTEEMAGKIADVLLELWPPDIETNAIHMLSVSGALIIEMRQDLKPFWESRPYLKAPAIWQEIETSLDKIFEYFNADLSEDYIYSERVPEAVEKLQKVVWPEVSATPAKRFLYLVNDNYWVVATDKKEAGALVKQAYDIAITQVETIPPNEILDNGQPASSLLDLAVGQEKIVAVTKNEKALIW